MLLPAFFSHQRMALGLARRLVRALPFVAFFGAGLFLFWRFNFGAVPQAALAPVYLMVGGMVSWLFQRGFYRRRAARSTARELASIAGLLAVAGGVTALWWQQRVSPAQIVWLVAFGIVAGVAARRLASHAFQSRSRVAGAGTRLVILVALSLGLMSPYATTAFMGSGDSRHYGLQLADYVTQFREGVFPVLMGRTIYAFNGDFHPLRTAPAFHFFGGFLDVATLGSLHAFALQNLLLVLTHLAATLCAYGALLSVTPRRPWLCCGLAALYATSPGLLGLAYGGDMYASWMTLPWLPLIVAAWVHSLRNVEPGRPLLVMTVALALLWLSHAPIALWCTLFSCIGWMMRIAIDRRRAVWLGCRLAGAAALFVALAGYVFFSVFALELPRDPYQTFERQLPAIFQSLDAGWRGLLRSVSYNGSNLLADLFPAPGLWLGGVFALGLGWRTLGRAGWFLAALIFFQLALLYPDRTVATRLWTLMPDAWMGVLEKWPMQRLAPILSAMLPFAIALGWENALRRQSLRLALYTGLALACAWSIWDARKFYVVRAHIIAQSTENTLKFLRPENSRLARYSYEMSGAAPRFFSHGVMNPSMQVRLLAEDHLTVLETNHDAISRSPLARARATKHCFVPRDDGGHFTPALRLEPGTMYLAIFDFRHRQPTGVMSFDGRFMQRQYYLPIWGGSHAFGAGETSAPHVALWVTDEADTAEVRFYNADGQPPVEFGDLHLLPFPRADLPYRVDSFVPFGLRVRTKSDGWLLTPKLFIPGYRAWVDGKPTPIQRSHGGKVLLPIRAGTHLVDLHYVGPTAVNVSFWIGITAWSALLGWAGLRFLGFYPNVSPAQPRAIETAPDSGTYQQTSSPDPI